MSRPGWLTYSGTVIHIRGHPSAVGRAQDRESSPVKDQRSTTVPRNQTQYSIAAHITHRRNLGIKVVNWVVV